MCFLEDPSSPDLLGWRVGHRLPQTSQQGPSPSSSVTHVLSECSWCQALAASEYIRSEVHQTPLLPSRGGA